MLFSNGSRDGCLDPERLGRFSHFASAAKRCSSSIPRGSFHVDCRQPHLDRARPHCGDKETFLVPSFISESCQFQTPGAAVPAAHDRARSAVPETYRAYDGSASSSIAFISPKCAKA